MSDDEMAALLASFAEATAEVERLRHNEAFHVERAAAQDVEIERLKTGLSEALADRDAHFQRAERNAAEVERLRATLDCCKGYEQDIMQLEAEVEGLRAALRDARQYVSDAITDEDPETQHHADALIGQINAALGKLGTAAQVPVAEPGQIT